MLEDIKKSIQLVLYERITSPLSGALCFSWLVWNWRILYILIYSDASFSLQSRLGIVDQYYLHSWNIIIAPIISAIGIVFIYPVATSAALYAWLYYKKFQNDIRNRVEKSQLLTVDQSMQIRSVAQQNKDEYARLLQNKDDEIKQLKEKVSILENSINKPTEQSSKNSPLLQIRPAPKLTKLATEILMAAVEDGGGLIREKLNPGNFEFIGIQTGEKIFKTSHRHDEDNLRAAIKELVTRLIIQGADGFYTITEDGYKFFDNLKKEQLLTSTLESVRKPFLPTPK